MKTGDVIRAVAPALDRALVSEQALAGLTAAGDLLPLTTGGGFECHLGQPDRVDLAVRFMTEDGGREALQGALARPAGPLSGPEWGGIRQLVQAWTAPGHPAYSRVRNLWLEWDLGTTRARLPGVFFDVAPGPGGIDGEVDLALALAGALKGRALPPEVWERMAACCRGLPTHAWLRYVGVMLGREGDGIRLALYGLRPQDLTQYLEAAGWPGEPAVVDEAAALAATAHPSLVVGLDVSESVGPALGVEFALHGPTGTRAAWQHLLERVLARTRCPEELGPALLRWPGMSRATDPAWPEALGRAWQRAVRRLNHVKVVWRGAEPPRVKVYLYYGLLPD